MWRSMRKGCMRCRRRRDYTHYRRCRARHRRGERRSPLRTEERAWRRPWLRGRRKISTERKIRVIKKNYTYYYIFTRVKIKLLVQEKNQLKSFKKGLVVSQSRNLGG